jgi:hypothetical protein
MWWISALEAVKWTRRGQAVQDGAEKELAPVGTSQTGARRTFRVRLTGRIRAALPRSGVLGGSGYFARMCFKPFERL